MTTDRIIFRVHAVQRMFERLINADDVRSVLRDGEMIESYPDDTPYPSRLVLGWVDIRPLHVVVAETCRIVKVLSLLFMSQIPSCGSRVSKGENNEVCCLQAWDYSTRHDHDHS